GNRRVDMHEAEGLKQDRHRDGASTDAEKARQYAHDRAGEDDRCGKHKHCLKIHRLPRLWTGIKEFRGAAPATKSVRAKAFLENFQRPLVMNGEVTHCLVAASVQCSIDNFLMLFVVAATRITVSHRDMPIALVLHHEAIAEAQEDR